MWHRRVKKDPDATRAVADAKRNLEQVKSRDEEVHKVVEASKAFRRKNHFAEQLGALFGTHPPTRKGHA